MHLTASAGTGCDDFQPSPWTEGDLTARPLQQMDDASHRSGAAARVTHVVVAPGSPLEPFVHGLRIPVPGPEGDGAHHILVLSREQSDFHRGLAVRLEEAAESLAQLLGAVHEPRATCGWSGVKSGDLGVDPWRSILLEVLAGVAEGAGAGTQFNELAAETLNRIVDGLALDGGALYFSLDDAWLLVGHRGFDEHFPMTAGFLPAPALDWTRSNVPLVDFDAGLPLTDLFKAGSIRSWLFLPVVEQESVRGGMLLASSRRAAFDDARVELLDRIRVQLIHSLRHAELRARLEQKAHDLEAVIGHLSDALLVGTRDLRILEANPAAASLLGVTAGLPGAASWQQIVPLADTRTGAEAGEEHPVQRAFATGLPQPPTQWKLANAARTTILSVTAAPVLDLETGAVRSVVLVLRDQSEQHARDRKILAAEKYASISTLAAGVAHEFKNYLAGMVGNAGLIEQHARGDGAVARAARRILDIGSRANQTALSLLSYVRDSGDEQRTVHLAPLLGEILCLVEERLQSQQIRVVTSFAPEPCASVVPMKLRQAVLNVLINAIEAMPSGGQLRVDLTAAPNEALVRIADTGVGIPAGDLSRVFDPFFSTKGVWGRQEGAGTGLGLTTSLNYLQEMGGSLEIESSEGKGTTVTLHLPAAQPELRTRSESAADASEQRLALLFESDPAFAKILESAFGQLGWRTEWTTNLKELCARTESELPGVVVLDATVPGKMTFARAFEHFASTSPHCKILVSTGDATDYQLDDYMTRSAGRLVKSAGADRIGDLLKALLSPSRLPA